MTLLAVEDEPKTLASLLAGLGAGGFEVQGAADGEEALRLARAGVFDLILLDVDLPFRSGWSVIQELRASGCTTPVLMLTAQDTIADRVRGLDLGADDYLVKPFAFPELLARVRSLLRRPRTAPPMPQVPGGLELAHGDARREGRALNLTRQEFLLLSFFLEHREEVVSRALIAREVWGINFDCDTNIVEVAVRRLRRKLDDPFEAKLLHTVKGLGYVLRTG